MGGVSFDRRPFSLSLEIEMKITKKMLKQILKEEFAIIDSKRKTLKMMKESAGRPGRVDTINQEILDQLNGLNESVKRSRRSRKTRR